MLFYLSGLWLPEIYEAMPRRMLTIPWHRRGHNSWILGDKAVLCRWRVFHPLLRSPDPPGSKKQFRSSTTS